MTLSKVNRTEGPKKARIKKLQEKKKRKMVLRRPALPIERLISGKRKRGKVSEL